MISSRAFREFDPTERLYCSVATAIIGSGLIGAGASIFGASKAADAQTAAANAAIANQRQMFGINQANLSPFINAGAGRIDPLNALLDPNNQYGPLRALMGVTQGNVNGDNTTTLDNLAKTPGYQFSLTQGLRGVNNQLAARGLGGSGGAVAKGAGAFTTGLAQSTWQSVVQALQNSFNSQVGANQNLVNTGANAAGALANVGGNTANAITGSLTGAGNAQAASYNAMGSTVANNAPISMIALQQLLKGGQTGGVQSGNTGVYDPSALPGTAQSAYYGPLAPQTA